MVDGSSNFRTELGLGLNVIVVMATGEINDDMSVAARRRWNEILLTSRADYLGFVAFYHGGSTLFPEHGIAVCIRLIFSLCTCVLSGFPAFSVWAARNVSGNAGGNDFIRRVRIHRVLCQPIYPEVMLMQARSKNAAIG